MKITKKAKSRGKSPVKSADIPVTMRLLDLVKQELKSDIETSRLENRAEFKKIDARFQSAEARFDGTDARFQSIDARFESMDAKLQSMDTKLIKMLVLLEEQNARNKVVLDGYTHIYDRQHLSEERIVRLEKKVLGIEQK